ncbi:MAG: ABC transporter permease [Vallitaleaceae bacterium]|nr:ABC transporter permease [Vallitaleaceae bacterium]
METTNMYILFFLVLPVFLFNIHYAIKMNGQIAFAIFRMILQLSLIGLVLQWLFDMNTPWINVIYIIFMMTIASYSMLKTTKLSIKTFGFHIWLAVFIPHFLVLLFFNYFIVDLTDVFDAQYLIPIGGMLLGNSLSGNILAINTFYKQIKDGEKTYYYNLSLSASRSEALKPYFVHALKSSISPTIASIETIGLVSLPGMMTGQILGGSIPITAIKYQIAIMIAIFSTRYLTAVLAIYLTRSRAFDDYDRLKPHVIGNS